MANPTVAVQNNVVILSETDPRFTLQANVVASGAATTITTGVPTKGADAAAASWTGAVLPMVDGNGTTAQRFTGIAKADSTDTASAAGLVTLWLPLPGLVYAAKAKTGTGADTVAEIQALAYKRVVFDLTGTGGFWSVDAAAADALTNCVQIVGGDYQTQVLWFIYMSTGSIFANLTA